MPSEDCLPLRPAATLRLVAAAVENHVDATEVVAFQHLVGTLQAADVDLRAGVELLCDPGGHQSQVTRKAGGDHAADKEQNETSPKRVAGPT